MFNADRNLEIKKSYHPNGNLSKVAYLKDGLFHREDGPAWISFYEDGSVEQENYYREGKMCRGDTTTTRPPPISLWYDKAGEIKIEAFLIEEVRDEGYTTMSTFIDAAILVKFYETRDAASQVKFFLGKRQISFWDFYDRVSEANQKILLRVWLPYV
jgi:antitoxin component YwqK of YwqJK toxin-antitoxin module